MFRFLLVFVVGFVCENEAAKILAYYAVPSISHQVVYRSLTLELVSRGHEVVVITTDPIFPNGERPANLTEIDIGVSYGPFKEIFTDIIKNAEIATFVDFTRVLLNTFDAGIKLDTVQKFLKDKSQKFDLIIAEAWMEFTLGLTHIYKDVPVIQFSSTGATINTLKAYGAYTHPFIYPTMIHQRVYNLTLLDKYNKLIADYETEQGTVANEELIMEVMRRGFGEDVPKLDKLRSNVDMLFMNVHPVWDFNRPVPPSVIYLGGLHQKPEKSLPKDLQTYLDSSKNGVIYVSFGTNVDPALFPPEKVQTLVNAFSKLPYDVLWKWNKDELPGRTANIRISKWLPQSDLLRHPKIKLFVTQGGLQSTDEAITAGVPLIGIPIFADQKFNVEQYIYHGIGVRVEIETVTEEKLTNAINTIIRDDSYRKNAEKLRAIITDQPQTPLERAVWWTEYVIRHKGAKHLRSPAANMSMAEYVELELISYILLALFLALAAVVLVVRFLYKLVFRNETKLKKN